MTQIITRHILPKIIKLYTATPPLAPPLPRQLPRKHLATENVQPIQPSRKLRPKKFIKCFRPIISQASKHARL